MNTTNVFLADARGSSTPRGRGDVRGFSQARGGNEAGASAPRSAKGSENTERANAHGGARPKQMGLDSFMKKSGSNSDRALRSNSGKK